MAIIKKLNGITPTIAEDCFIAENAVIIGDVVLGKGCSVWFGAVIRGDVEKIRIGENVNIQDNAVIHATYKTSPTNIGNNVTIAHGTIIHGCNINDNVLVGMNAVVLDDAIIEPNVIVAAGAVVTKGTRLTTGGVYAGTPAKRIKELDEKLLNGEILRIAESYAMYASWYKE